MEPNEPVGEYIVRAKALVCTKQGDDPNYELTHNLDITNKDICKGLSPEHFQRKCLKKTKQHKNVQ